MSLILHFIENKKEDLACVMEYVNRKRGEIMNMKKKKIEKEIKRKIN